MNIILFLSVFILPITYIFSFPVANSTTDFSSFLFYIFVFLKKPVQISSITISLFLCSLFSIFLFEDLFIKLPLLRSLWTSFLFSPFLLIAFFPYFRVDIKVSSLQLAYKFYALSNIIFLLVNISLINQGSYRFSFPFDEPARLSVYCSLSSIPLLFAIFKFISIPIIRDFRVNQILLIAALICTYIMSVLTLSSQTFLYFLLSVFFVLFAFLFNTSRNYYKFTFKIRTVYIYSLVLLACLIPLIFYVVDFNILFSKFNVFETHRLTSFAAVNLSSLSWLNGFSNAVASATYNIISGFGLGSYGYLSIQSNMYSEILFQIYGTLNEYDGFSLLFKTIFEWGLLFTIILFGTIFFNLFKAIKLSLDNSDYYNLCTKLMSMFALFASLLKEPTLTFFTSSSFFVFFILRVI